MKTNLHYSLLLLLITCSFYSFAQVETRLGWDDDIPVYFSEFHYNDENTPQDLEFLEIVTIPGYSLDGWSIEIITEDSTQPEPYIWQSLSLSGYGTLDETHKITLVTHFINVPWVDYFGFTYGGIPNNPAAVLLRDPAGEVKEFISAGGTIIYENIESHAIKNANGSFVTENNSTSVGVSMQNNGFNIWVDNIPSSPNEINKSYSQESFAGWQRNINQAYEVTWNGINGNWDTENWAVFDGTTDIFYGIGFYQQSTLNIPFGTVILNTDTSSEIYHTYTIPNRNFNTIYKTHVKRINVDGTFFIDLLGSLEVNEAIFNTGTLNINGTLLGTLDIINSGTFIMNSEQISATTIDNTGTINVGDQYGSTFTGDLTTTGTISLNINGNVPRTINGFEQIAIVGDLELNGTLDVNVDLLYLPADGTSHNIITYTGNLTGTFVNIILPDSYRVDYSTPGEINIIRDTTLSTLNLNADLDFTYYPNPVSNSVTFKSQKEIQNISVYNLLGQEILHVQPNSYLSNVNMANFQSGYYFVKVTIGNSIETVRIIKN